MNMAVCNSLAQRRDERRQLRTVPRRIIVQFKQGDGCGGEDDERNIVRSRTSKALFEFFLAHLVVSCSWAPPVPLQETPA